jgi:hypothetical protein
LCSATATFRRLRCDFSAAGNTCPANCCKVGPAFKAIIESFLSMYMQTWRCVELPLRAQIFRVTATTPKATQQRRPTKSCNHAPTTSL